MPNNKNIIMASTQAKEISEKNIEVVKTRTIPEAIMFHTRKIVCKIAYGCVCAKTVIGISKPNPYDA